MTFLPKNQSQFFVPVKLTDGTRRVRRAKNKSHSFLSSARENDMIRKSSKPERWRRAENGKE